ncbi:hypothetical protein KJ708_14495 [bacterium]|nr:hypothetical protein [bacterium]MBU1918741.1 hypothetical protein [bacterium]
MSDNFWRTSQTNNINKFSDSSQNYQTATRSFWNHLTTIQAGLLGLTLPLSMLSQLPLNWLLVAAWCLQLLSVGLGLLMIKHDIDREFWASYDSFRFAFNMNEINADDIEGKFNNDPNKKTGLLLATMDDWHSNLGLNENLWTDEAKRLIEIFKSEKPSNTFMVDNPKAKKTVLLKFFKKHYALIITAFYISIFLSLSCLLFGTFMRLS